MSLEEIINHIRNKLLMITSMALNKERWSYIINNNVKKVLNHEYNMVIVTLYKGSNKESNNNTRYGPKGLNHIINAIDNMLYLLKRCGEEI